VDGKIYADAVVKNIYQLLGGNEIFPCVSVCPLDPLTEQEEGKLMMMNILRMMMIVMLHIFYNYFTNH
jgi:hypothetical protein